MSEWIEVARYVGTRIRDMRRRRGLTQAQVEQRTARFGDPYPTVTAANLSHIERAYKPRGMPTLRTLMTIARALDLPVGALLVGSDDRMRGGHR